jgi:hypothetical protein
MSEHDNLIADQIEAICIARLGLTRWGQMREERREYLRQQVAFWLPAVEKVVKPVVCDDVIEQITQAIEAVIVAVRSDTPPDVAMAKQQQNDAAIARGFKESEAKVELLVDEGMAREIRRIVGECAGAVSVCWQPRPDGLFDSTQAAMHVDDAMAQLLLVLREGPDEVPLEEEK